jgi:hypothetical protein
MSSVWPFKSTPTLTPTGAENVAPESSSGAVATLAGLKELETRVKQLELGDAERQVAVMNALEKVMYQLRAREDRRRARETDVDDEQVELPVSDGGRAHPTQPTPDPLIASAGLARRFRRW